jgi:hypothetical protein
MIWAFLVDGWVAGWAVETTGALEDEVAAGILMTMLLVRTVLFSGGAISM